MSDTGCDQGALRCPLSWLLGCSEGLMPGRNLRWPQELVWAWPLDQESSAQGAATGPRSLHVWPCHLVSCLSFPSWLAGSSAFSPLSFIPPPTPTHVGPSAALCEGLSLPLSPPLHPPRFIVPSPLALWYGSLLRLTWALSHFPSLRWVLG